MKLLYKRSGGMVTLSDVQGIRIAGIRRTFVDMRKIETYIPEEALKDIQEALLAVDAGHIGKYRGCMNWYPVTGSWIPLEGSQPLIGNINERSIEPELKVEVVIKDEQTEETVSAIRWVHPYEEPVINVIQLV